MKKTLVVFTALMLGAVMYAAKPVVMISGTSAVLRDGGETAHFVVDYDHAMVGSLNKKLEFKQPEEARLFSERLAAQGEESIAEWEKEHIFAEQGFADVFKLWEKKKMWVKIVKADEPAKYTIKLTLDKLDLGSAVGEIFASSLVKSTVILVGKVEYIDNESGDVLATIAVNGVRGSDGYTAVLRLRSAFNTLSYSLIGLK